MVERLNKTKKIYQSVLGKLAVEIPLFAETILDKALAKVGTNSSQVTAFQMKKAIELYVEPMLKKNLKLEKGVHEIGMGIIYLDKKRKVINCSPLVYKLIPNIENKRFTIGNEITSRVITSKDKTIKIIVIPVKIKGNVEGAVGLISDITLEVELDKEIRSTHKFVLEQNEKLKKSEEELRESEEKFRDLFENAMDLIQSVNAEGKFVYVNNEWKKVMGYSDQEIKKLNLTDILRKDQIPHCMELFQEVCQGKSFKDIETVFVAKNGKEIIVSGNVNAHFKDGRFISTRAIFRDITKQRMAEGESEKFNQFAIGRELKMVELKKEVNELLRKAGRRPKYNLDFLEVKNSENSN